MKSNAIYLLKLHFIVIALTLFSCGGKKTLITGEVNPSLPTRTIIQQHYLRALDFNTMSARIKVDYKDGDDTQGVTLSLRMKKDEVIWLSAPLGMFKAHITPDRVAFYNKLEGAYFEGDFSYISELLGTAMDFDKVQNVLIGNTLLNLKEKRYLSTYNSDGYGLSPKVQDEVFDISFLLDPLHFRVKEQALSQKAKNRRLNMSYEYQQVFQKIVPNTLAIEAILDSGLRTIAIEYKQIDFNKELRFPYKVPKGYKTIVSQ